MPSPFPGMDPFLEHPMLWRVCFFLPAALAASAAVAAGPRQRAAMPWMDPSGMFQQMFGPETPEEQKELEKIPISPREEEQLGRQAADAYRAYLRQQRIRVVDRGKDVEYLRRLVEIVHPYMEHAARYRRFTIYVAESPRCDARSFPGGTLIFFRGLLDAAQDEAALVTTVGHELAHLDRGHLLTRLRRMKRAQQAFAGGGRGKSFLQSWDALAGMIRIWTRPFRQEDELEADRDGATWAYKAGYDPRELNRLLVAIGKREAKLPPMMATFFQSHPPAEVREKALAEVYDELQRTEPRDDLAKGRENFRRRVPRSVRAFPEK